MRTQKLLCLPLYFSAILVAATSSRSPCSPDRFDLDGVVPRARILAIEAKSQHNYTSLSSGHWPSIRGLNFCQVQIHLTHETSRQTESIQDEVLIEVWLPLTGDEWNGRFQATGGAGWATGMFEGQLGAAVNGGWAAVSTNGGYGRHPLMSGDASRFLTKDSTVDWNLLYNFAIRSPVEQIAIGKSITKQYFGKDPHHSYWNGCSTGGRQGYAIAQRFPNLLNGILAEAPAISFTQLVTGLAWPQIRMAATGTFLSNCELKQYRAKVMEACDLIDGVQDNVLEDPEQCTFHPVELSQNKTVFYCDGKEKTWNSDMTSVLADILDGPGTTGRDPLFPGFALGVPLHKIANITIDSQGRRAQNPFSISESFFKNLLLKDPDFEFATLEKSSYFELFGKASYEYGGLLNADHPDLSLLQASGTKLLSWHGLEDELIPYRNTLSYRQKVEDMMTGGRSSQIDDFYRLFLAPGVAHCKGGTGPMPSDPLAALVDWVEHDMPPDTLHAETTDAQGNLISRDLCLWPAKSKYMGIGDAKRASSWSCEGGSDDNVDDNADTEKKKNKNKNKKPVGEDEFEQNLGASRAQEIMGVLADRFKGLGLNLNVE